MRRADTDGDRTVALCRPPSWHRGASIDALPAERCLSDGRAEANGLTLGNITQLSYTVMHSSANDSPIAAPYLRVFLAGGHDVIFDATECATVVPAEDAFATFEVTTGDVRYDDDSCDGVPPDQQPWATVQAAHAGEVIEGIYITAGFTGGTGLSAILRTLSVNGEAFTFGSA